MVWDPPSTIVELKDHLQHNHQARAEGKAYTWTIEARGDACFIGRVALRKTDQQGVWSLGYWICPIEKSKGYATESVVAVLELGFTIIEAIRITAAHAIWNEASGRVLQKAGMLRTGFNPKGFQKNGKWVEEYEYQIESNQML